MRMLSVIVPVYNSEKYLEKCLESVLRSAYTNLEIICINDGSTDSSLEILKKYELLDNRIIVINKKNEGPQKAREKGYEICKGEYITNIDSDDWIEKDTFTLAINMLEENRVDIALYDTYFWYHPNIEGQKKINKVSNGSIISGEEAFILSLDWSIGGLGIFKRDILLKSINVKELYNGDEVITRKLFLNSRQVGCCNGKYYYRQNNLSLTRSEIFKIKSCEIILSNIQIEKMIMEKNIKHERISRFRISNVRKLIGKIKEIIKNKEKLTLEEKTESKRIICLGIKEIKHKKIIIYLLKRLKFLKLLNLYFKLNYFIYKLKKI